MVEWLKEALGGSCFDSNSSTGGCRHRSEFAQFYAGCTFGPSVACAVGSLPCNAWFWSAHCYWRRVLFHPLPLRTTAEFAPRSTAHMKFISVQPKRLLENALEDRHGRTAGFAIAEANPARTLDDSAKQC